MFKLKKEPELYKTCYSEYLTEKYPHNFFNFGIDIGACGVVHKWHINHMGKDNPNTTFIGFEPETNGFNLIQKECETLKNVRLYKQFFGRDISLKDILANHNLNPDDRWSMSCDCEGDEKYLLQGEDLEILKKCTHFALEFHPKLSGISNENFINIIKNNFGNTHKIIRTYNGGGGYGALDNSSYVIVKNKVYEDELKNIVSYLVNHPQSKQHSIFFIN